MCWFLFETDLLSALVSYYLSELTLNNVDKERKARFLVHLLQLHPDCNYKREAFKKYITVQSLDSTTHNLSVHVSADVHDTMIA